MKAADVHLKKMQQEVELEVVTPKRAEDFLNRNTANRKLRDGVVEKYAHDMQNGKWTECPAPICFYDNGDVADGQHRLWAIIESGTAQKFFIVRGMPREAGLNIDTGLGRSIVDNARIAGINSDLSNELLCVARAIDLGSRHSGGNISNAIRLAYVQAHNDAARWAMHNGPTGRFLRNSMTLGAVARAWYIEPDKERLNRFCKVLTNGFSEGTHESAAVAIRNYLLQNGGTTTLSAMWRDSFFKVQNAIYYFMRERGLTVIRRVSEEIYPLAKKNRVSPEQVEKTKPKKKKD